MLMGFEIFQSDGHFECIRLYSVYAVAIIILMIAFQVVSTILMLNLLIAMMAKVKRANHTSTPPSHQQPPRPTCAHHPPTSVQTFDRVAEDAATEFLFVRADTIQTWVVHHPSPPPFNLLAVVFNLLRQLVNACCGTSRTPPGVHGGPPPAQLDAEPTHFSLLLDPFDNAATRALASKLTAFINDNDERPLDEMVPSELEKVSERLMKRLDEQDALLQRILSANPNPNGANAGPVPVAAPATFRSRAIGSPEMEWTDDSGYSSGEDLRSPFHMVAQDLRKVFSGKSLQLPKSSGSTSRL